MVVMMMMMMMIMNDDRGDDGDGDLRDNTLVKVKHMKKAAAYLS